MTVLTQLRYVCFCDLRNGATENEQITLTGREVLTGQRHYCTVHWESWFRNNVEERS